MEEKNEKTKEKIDSLREMIYNAEKTLQGAKSMLLQLEGKKKVGRKRKSVNEVSGSERIVEGTFDGQVMIGTDGKQYPVPANYASKSKLVEGDMLKLTITDDGSFVYKQIGPIERKRLIGTVNQDSDGNYFITADGKAYKVLLASVTYFKVEPGDEVTLVTSLEIESDWGSIENVLQKSKPLADDNLKKDPITFSDETSDSGDDFISQLKSSRLEKTEDISNNAAPNPEEKNKPEKKAKSDTIVDEWTPDIEELRKELNEEK